jgi:predicted outer membrane repeat protein
MNVTESSYRDLRSATLRRLLLGLVIAGTVAHAPHAATWRVPRDAPSIQAGIDSAEAGDDVLVAPGEYFENDIDLAKAIWVHSQDGAAETIIDGQNLGRVLEVRNVSGSCTIEGFTVRGGRFPGGFDGGGGLACRSSTLTIKDCTFTLCWATEAAGAIYAVDSFLTIDACRFLQNRAGGGGGVVFVNHSLLVRDTQFVGNIAEAGSGGAISARGEVTISGCLFADNRDAYQSGAALYFYLVDGLVRSCTFADNRSAFGGGSNDICGIDGGGNFSADPLFCDLSGADYTLDADSPCLPGQHPDGADCGLIGALGEGCGESTPVREATWGSLKDRYTPRGPATASTQ